MEWRFRGSAFVVEVDLLLFQETMREEEKSSLRFAYGGSLYYRIFPLVLLCQS